MIALLSRCGRGIVLLFVLSLVMAALQFVVPLYMMAIYNRILQTGSMETLKLISMIAGGLLLVLGIAESARSRILAMMAARISTYLNNDVYQAVLASPASVLGSAVSAANVLGGEDGTMARQQAITDVRNVTAFVASGALNTFFDALLAPIFLLSLFFLHPFLGWVGVTAIVLILTLAVIAEIVARFSNKSIGEAEGRAQSRIERLFGQFDAVTSMGIAPNLYKRWESDRKEADRLSLRSQSIVGAIGGLARSIRLVVQIAVLGLGAWLALNTDGFLAGAIIASSIIMTRALAPIDQSINVWQRFVRARAGAARLMRIVHAVDSLPERPPAPPPAPQLLLDNVTLVFPGQKNPMLDGATLNITKGQVLGILGPVGSGKTTLLRAMAGLHSPRAGKITLGVTPVDAFTDENRQRDLGYLPQDIQLLPGTIGENISRFVDAKGIEAQVNKDVFQACDMVNATSIAEALPEGFGAEYAPDRLSAGQTQLLGLARAFYGDPLLVLLDEPTANLDAATKQSVIAAIEARKATGKMTVLVSHDPEVLNAADTLLYIAPGLAKLGAAKEIMRFLAHRQQQAVKALSKQTNTVENA